MKEALKRKAKNQVHKEDKMTRKEFLQGLKEALDGNMDASAIQETSIIIMNI